MSRRFIWSLLLVGLAAGAMISSAAPAPAPTPTAPTPAAPATPTGKGDRVDLTILRAVAFILSQQDGDGSFTDRERRGQHQTVMTGLSLLSLASVGHEPMDPTPEGDAMRRGIDFLMREDRQMVDGYYGNKDGSRMYGHGIITLALSELLGMGVDKNQDRALREHCTKAIELILRSQQARKHSTRFEGGWRYTPDSGDSDLSVTVWQLMALRSAKNAGIPVPKQAIDAAVQYLKGSYRSDRTPDGRIMDPKNGFGYQPGGGAEFATTAAGLLALQVCGEYEAPEVVGASDWLLDLTEGNVGRKGKRVEYGNRWFFYGTYYYAQGMQKRGGNYARQAKQFVEGLLVDNQLPDGSWISGDGQERSAGRVYSTALGILSLSVRYHYLPIYQY